MTIKEGFLESDDESGFGRFVKAMIDQRIIRIRAYQRYCHRRSISGERLFYIALVANKARDISTSLLDELNENAPAPKKTNSGHIATLLGTSN